MSDDAWLRSSLVSARNRALWTEIASVVDDTDLAHDWTHVLRVYRWAVALAPEAGVEADLAGACALVRDLVNVPKDAPERSLAGSLSAQAAVTHLRAAGYSSEEIDAIGEAVRTSSWSRGLEPTSDLGRVLQDADRLDAIGAIGVARTFACAQAMSVRGQGRFYHPVDPHADRREALDDRAFALDHFENKLLRLAEGMHLPSAREEARRRQRAMVEFLDAMRGDLAIPTRPESDTAT